MELKEFRCKICGKLLCKGNLQNKDCSLEVKCRKCHTVSAFFGEDAEIIKQRSKLIRNGGIPDTEIN